MAEFTVKGLDKLQKAIEKRVSMDKVVGVVKKHTTEVQQSAMKKAGTTYTAVYKSGKHKGQRISTGATQQGIKDVYSDRGLTGTVGMPMEYNPYTENGTRFMAAKPVLKPVFDSQKTQFQTDLEKLLK